MKPKWYPNFSQWMGPEVIQRWQLVKDTTLPDFQNWIGCPAIAFDPVLEVHMDSYRRELDLMHAAWNETELLANFIAPIINLVRFRGPTYNLFYERKLSVRMEEGTLRGSVDGLVALGLSQPETPYFFIHEYKRARAPESDPQGQLLVTMLAAQHLNSANEPLYGCHIIGRFWTFVYLTGRTFAESQGYDASDPGELRTVLAILHETKRRIEARVAAAG